jgi:hypothetical protein
MCCKIMPAAVRPLTNNTEFEAVIYSMNSITQCLAQSITSELLSHQGPPDHCGARTVAGQRHAVLACEASARQRRSAATKRACAHGLLRSQPNSRRRAAVVSVRHQSGANPHPPNEAGQSQRHQIFCPPPPASPATCSRRHRSNRFAVRPSLSNRTTPHP